jgi:hypothetical protein
MAYRMVHYLDIPSPEPAANPAFATAASGLTEIAQFFNSVINRNRADLTQCRSGSFGRGRQAVTALRQRRWSRWNCQDNRRYKGRPHAARGRARKGLLSHLVHLSEMDSQQVDVCV